MPRCLISLGANLGDPRRTLEVALQRIEQCPRIVRVSTSRFHRTRPIGGPAGQREYLNAVALCETSLPPQDLLEFLLNLEIDLGRERRTRWDARTIDLDLLLYDDLVTRKDALVLPHPRMAFRRFVLSPAVEIAADWVHPTTGWTIRRLVQHLDEASNYVAIAGAAGTGKTFLAQQTASAVVGKFLADPIAGYRPSVRDDQASLDPNMEIEFLRQRAQLLSRHTMAARQTGAYCISDFWLDQSLACARRETTPDGVFGRLEQLRDELRPNVIGPKLLILLEPAPHASPRNGLGCQGQEFCSELVKQARDSAVGPWLILSAKDRGRAKAEIKAAIEAME